MTSKERQRKIESYGSVYETLINHLKCFPREMRQFRPATDHRSIHDIIVHIANSEVESYILCGRLLAKFAYALPDYETSSGYTIRENTVKALMRHSHQSKSCASPQTL